MAWRLSASKWCPPEIRSTLRPMERTWRGTYLLYRKRYFQQIPAIARFKERDGVEPERIVPQYVRGQGRVKITRGTCIASESEEEIFRLLGVPWRPPELRNC